MKGSKRRNFVKLNSMSLISRMIFLYIVGPLLLFVLFCIFTIYFVGNEMNHRMQLSIKSDLVQTMNKLEENTDTLMMVVEQMAFGYVSTNLVTMLGTVNKYEKSQLMQTIKDELNVISFTNRNIGLLGYYNKDEEKFVFVSNGATDDKNIEKDNQLTRKHEFTFFGPHKSHARNEQALVISVSKKVPGASEIEAYVELKIDLKATNSFLMQSDFAIMDMDNQFIYNAAKREFSAEERKEIANQESGIIKDCYWMKGTSTEGYQVLIFVPRSEYNVNVRAILPGILIAFISLSLLLTGIAVLLIFNIIRPLHIFLDEIKEIQKGNFEIHQHQLTYIPEYDRLIQEVAVMKGRIQSLIEEREDIQRIQAKTKVEQLMYKINPHFLMNSLDTIHWLAVAKNETQIDTVAKALNKLLYYNLKIDSNIVTLLEEVQAVQQYVTLQQSRFNFEYILEVKTKNALEALVPRFILQPLVENAIYHGLTENGILTLRIVEDESLHIFVKDNGEGMNQDRLDDLVCEINRFQEDNKMGIGLNYVIQVLKERYGEEAVIRIDSKLQEGTTIHISIPMEKN